MDPKYVPDVWVVLISISTLRNCPAGTVIRDGLTVMVLPAGASVLIT
jgi:hypothetical protein